MTRTLLSVLFLFFFLIAPVQADEKLTEEDIRTSANYSETDTEEGNIFISILLYLPNRILDLMDIFRARLRIGPGIAAGIRITDAGDLYLGSYVSMYAGLPGPRGRKLPRSPIGVESYNGAEISLAAATTGFGVGPEYTFSEVGLDAQIALVGFAFSIDPAELVDFVAGIFTIDIMDDDYQD